MTTTTPFDTAASKPGMHDVGGVPERGNQWSGRLRQPAQHWVAPVRYITQVKASGPGRSELIVSSPDRQHATIRVAAEPHPDAVVSEIPARCRPLAIRIELQGSRTECTCVAATRTGPQRLPISMSAGLALVATGVHGIVTSAPLANASPAHEKDPGSCPSN